VFKSSWIAATLLTAIFAAGTALAADVKSEVYSFGTLRSVQTDAARAQAQDWLNASGKTDDATRKQFDAIWNQADRALLDKISDTLSLDANAAKLLKDAGDLTLSVPKEVPALIKDAKQPEFYRVNLALLFAKAISNRRVYEEALDALKAVKPEKVADPSAYLFHKAVAEHALMKKDEAAQSIVRLLDDVADAPDRYKIVSLLMLYDMQTWKDKDLGWIARKMDNIERRLELARGGPQTQKMQTEVVRRLDEIIKELENQQKGS